MSAARLALRVVLVPLLVALGACSTSKGARTGSGTDAAATRGGGYYLDDGPGHLSPADVAAIPDAVPRAEPVLLRTSRPYTVFGRTYTPMNALAPYRERGIASWYGKRYHGKPTSSGEPYDMYAMTAAHPTLPIPSYVRVTRTGTQRSVVVRVNDRGPFLQNRLIDLSYTAAAKLGFVEAGSAEVDVEAITQFDAPVLVAQSGAADGQGEGGAAGPRVDAAAGGAPAAAGSVVSGPVVSGSAAPGPTASASASASVAPSAPMRPAGAASTSTSTSTSADSPVALVAAGSSGGSSAAAPARGESPGRLAVETSFADDPARQSGLSSVAEASTSFPDAPPSAAVLAPAVPTPAAAVPGTVQPRAAPAGFWLQLGAFASADAARAALERFRRELAWLGAQLDVRHEGELFKVQAGPWPQREHALDAAARVRGATALKPFTIFR